MTLFEVLNKPEYWFRPSQIVHKLRFVTKGHRDSDLIPVRMPWGDVLMARAGDAIGKSLLTLGVHELAVSEILWRLVDPGDTCLDIGANIGYTTSLLAARVGPTGQVLSFEPHPQVFERLRTNWNNLASKLRITACESAVGLTDGYAELIEPSGFEENEGTASIASASFTECSLRGSQHRVSIRRLDSLFSGDQEFGLMKVDVEGAEADVFRGAERLLSKKRFKDIVWEDHHVFPSDSVQLLFRHGYRIYQFAKSILGVEFWDPRFERHFRPVPWETVNYLATIDFTRAESRLRPRGWRCLRAG